MNPVHVERRRRGRHHSPGSSQLSTRPLLNTNLLRNTPLTLAVATGVTLAMVGGAALAHADTSTGSASTSQDKVGQKYSDGLQISSNQKLWPIGHRTLTRYGKFMGSTTSPNGRYLAATSNDKKVVLQIFDQRSHKLIWRVGTADGVNQTLKDGTVGQEGPTYSPDGKYLWLPQGDQLTRFPVKKDGTLGTPKQIALAKGEGQGLRVVGPEQHLGPARQDRLLPRPHHRLRRPQRPEQGGGPQRDHRRSGAQLESRHRPSRAGLRRQEAVREQ